MSLRIVLGPRCRQPDRDAFDKALLDALVRAGLLLDDGDRGLAGRVSVTFARGPRKATHIVLADAGPVEPARPPRRRAIRPEGMSEPAV